MTTGYALNLTGNPRHEIAELPIEPPRHRGGRLEGEIDGVAMLDRVEQYLHTRIGELPGLERMTTEQVTRYDLIRCLHTARRGLTMKQRKERFWRAIRYYVDHGTFHPNSGVGQMLAECIRKRVRDEQDLRRAS